MTAYVIMLVPDATPETTPEALTVAVDVLLLLHAPAAVASDKVIVAPGHTDDAPDTGATVEVFTALISRTRLLLKSETYTLPEASNTTPAGNHSSAVAGAPPSPRNPPVPLPAIVVMIPVLRFTTRI